MKAVNSALGKSAAHVEGQGVVLAAVGFIADHHHIGALTEHLGAAEFLDQREDITVVAAKKFGELGTAGGMALIAFGLGNHACGLEGCGDLAVQVRAIGHDHKGPIAGIFALNLLAVEAHGVALAAALGLPEHPRLAMASPAGFEGGGNGVVDAQNLVVLSNDLHQASFCLAEEGEVFDVIEKACRLAGAAEHHLQRHPAGLIFPFDALPFKKAFPVGGQGADAAGGAIGSEKKAIAPEELRNRRFVVGEVAGEGRAGGHTGPLELHHHQREAIDKAHQIGPAVVEVALDIELVDGQKIVVGWVVPIDHPQPFLALPAPLVISHGNKHAIFEPLIDLMVGGHQGHGGAIAAEICDGGGNGLRGLIRIEPFERRP